LDKGNSSDYDFENIISIDDELPLWSAPFGLKLLEHVIYKPDLIALDIGFGSGFPLIELAMRLGKNARVYGIDPWKTAIERTHEKIRRLGIANITIVEGPAESMPLEDHSIDLITSNNGINNARDIEKVVSECSRVIRKEGQFLVTMNLDKTMFEFYNQLEQVLTDWNMDQAIDGMHAHIAQKRPPLDKITSTIQKHGFVIRDLEHDQFSYTFADGTAMMNHHKIRSGFMQSWMQFLPRDRSQQILDEVEQRLNRLARIAGKLSLSIPFVVINALKK